VDTFGQGITTHNKDNQGALATFLETIFINSKAVSRKK